MNDEFSDSSKPQQKGLMERISRFLAGEPQDRNDLLEVLREAQDNRLLDREALSMIEGVMQVSELRVRDIMIPRVQMVVVPRDAELESIFPLVIESAHSRFPVIEKDRSEVVGILLAKDLLSHALKDKQMIVEEIMRPAGFVPESKRLNVLLREFRTERNHMVIVADEYGMAAGLVTIEDVLEQIVGEIEDEHDFEEEENIIKKNDQEYTVNALTPIEDFVDYFELEWTDLDCETVGGLLVHKLEKMPKKGEKITIDQFQFEVLKADSRRVNLLKLKVSD